MQLTEVFEAIRPALVFFTPKVRPMGDETPRGRMPQIIGSGFVVSKGLVVTNDHVIGAFEGLPRLEGGQGHPGLGC